MGSNPTLSATFAKTLASLAGSGWQAIAREFWAKVVLRRRERSVRLGKEDNSPPAVSLTNCVPRRRPAPQHEPIRRNSLWRVVCPVAKRVLSRQTVRLHHSKHQPSAETLRRRDIGPAIPAERAQRWKESLDGTLDTVDPRCEHRVSDGTDSVAFREILEIRCRSRVCQPALRRLLSKSAQIERPGSPSTTC